MIRLYSVFKYLSDENKATINEACRKYGYEITYFDTLEEADGKVSDGEVMFCTNPALLHQMKDPKWVQSASAGVDRFLKTGIFDSGEVILTNSSGAYGRAISEHIIMVTLMLLRQALEYRRRIDDREWRMHLPIRSIAGSTIAIAGTGNIGQAAAARFKALGAEKVIGFNRSGRHPEGFDETYRMTDFASHMDGVDVVVMCMPGTPETVSIMDAEKIAAIPETAYLVNVGRGTSVDQDALIRALNEERIAGAALDVAEVEPVPADSPLWDTKNILLTPHCSGDYGLQYTVDTLVGFFCENLRRYAEGEELIKRIDPKAGY